MDQHYQKKVADFYPWSADSAIDGQFVLCLDNYSFSGEFILQECIVKLLRDGNNVHIISVNRGRGHYEAILRKHVR
jgi:hypothetical protein